MAGDNFVLPVKQIKPAVEETWSGVEAMLIEVKKSSMKPTGRSNKGKKSGRKFF